MKKLSAIVGSDHVAIPLKRFTIEHLKDRGVAVQDAGAHSPDIIVDYQDYAQQVACEVTAGKYDFGVVMCGTGIGVSIAANKVYGARAALCHSAYTAHQAKAHNDANILAMGAWVVNSETAAEILDEWLNTGFDGGRHTARLQVIDRYLPEPAPSEGKNLSPGALRLSMALSINPTFFGPVLFGGRFEQGLHALAQAGFKFVEISLRNADDLPPEDLQRLLDQYGLIVSALATGQGCLHDNLCFTNPDPERFRSAVSRFLAIIDLAGQLGTNVILGSVRGKLTGTAGQQARQRDQALRAAQECAQHARKAGVMLLLEPINRYETTFINSALEGSAFIDEIGGDQIKLLLDTFHMNIEEVDIPKSIHMSANKLGYVHIVDSNRQAPGQGHLDFRSVFAALKQIGYQGIVSAEILPIPDDESAVLRTHNYLAHLGLMEWEGTQVIQ